MKKKKKEKKPEAFSEIFFHIQAWYSAWGLPLAKELCGAVIWWCAAQLWFRPLHPVQAAGCEDVAEVFAIPSLNFTCA